MRKVKHYDLVGDFVFFGQLYTGHDHLNCDFDLFAIIWASLNQTKMSHCYSFQSRSRHALLPQKHAFFFSPVTFQPQTTRTTVCLKLAENEATHWVYQHIRVIDKVLFGGISQQAPEMT